MTVRYYFTQAPEAYDYGCTTTVRAGVENRHGDVFRLVAIDDSGGGTFHEDQVPRYGSGMHATWEVGSEDALALDALALGFPSLRELLGDPLAAKCMRLLTAVDAIENELRDDAGREYLGRVRPFLDVIRGLVDEMVRSGS